MGVKFFGKEPLSSLVDANCSNKPTDPSLGNSMEGTSSCADADEKKSSTSPTVSPMDEKASSPAKEVASSPAKEVASSPAKEVLSPSKITNLESNDEQLEGKPDSPCNKMPLRKTLVLAIAAGGEEVRKRKHKAVNNNSSQKKRRTDKGKIFVNTSVKCKSGHNKAPKKQKSVTHGTSASVSKEYVGNKDSGVQQKDEVLALLADLLLDFTLKNL